MDAIFSKQELIAKIHDLISGGTTEAGLQKAFEVPVFQLDTTKG